jgi:hypothetical protein
MRRSAGHVHGERKTMAVCDCHDFAAFAPFCRADTRTYLINAFGAPKCIENGPFAQGQTIYEMASI